MYLQYSEPYFLINSVTSAFTIFMHFNTFITKFSNFFLVLQNFKNWKAGRVFPNLILSHPFFWRLPMLVFLIQYCLHDCMIKLQIFAPSSGSCPSHDVVLASMLRALPIVVYSALLSRIIISQRTIVDCIVHFIAKSNQGFSSF